MWVFVDTGQKPGKEKWHPTSKNVNTGISILLVEGTWCGLRIEAFIGFLHVWNYKPNSYPPTPPLSIPPQLGFHSWHLCCSRLILILRELSCFNGCSWMSLRHGVILFFCPKHLFIWQGRLRMCRENSYGSNWSSLLRFFSCLSKSWKLFKTVANYTVITCVIISV